MRRWVVMCVASIMPGVGARGEPPPVFTTACVAADHALASKAGAEILEAGGNAVDAAVATSFALSVVRPYSCGIGGGGFMLICLRADPRDPSRGPVTIALDYREVAPAGASPRWLEDDPDPDAATHGGKAVCVPGTVAGLLHALDRYGRLDRSRVLAPAIRLAEEGFAADRHYVHTARTDDLVLPWFAKDPARAARFAFVYERLLHKGRIEVGDVVHVPEQAAALRLIAREGAGAFYKGDIAREMVRSVREGGGVLTMDDLAGYKVVEREPLRARIRGLEVLTMPPPSSGGIAVAQVLAMLDARRADFDAARALGRESPEYIHLLAETFKHAFADRARWQGDPGFVDVPVRGLLAPAYLRARAASIRLDGVLAPEAYGTASPPRDDAGTSHLCVVDADGSAVACTETINLIFGSMVAVEKYGFVLNDEMDDFLTRGGAPNAFGLAHADRNRPRPGARPLSSMTPTIVRDEDGRVRVLAGGAGGPRIISGTIQAVLNVLEFSDDALASVTRPRFHHQWSPDRLQLERAIAREPLAGALRRLGHDVGEREAVGNIQVIRRVDAGWEGGCDPRKGGQPAGY